METVIRAIQQAAPTQGTHPMGSLHFSVLAYSDNLALIAAGETHLREGLEIARQVVGWVSLKLIVSKCEPPAIDCMPQRHTIPTPNWVGQERQAIGQEMVVPAITGKCGGGQLGSIRGGSWHPTHSRPGWHILGGVCLQAHHLPRYRC